MRPETLKNVKLMKMKLAICISILMQILIGGIKTAAQSHGQLSYAHKTHFTSNIHPPKTYLLVPLFR